MQAWYQSLDLQDDLITLVQALSTIDANFRLALVWHVAWNKLSNLCTIIHQAEKESKVKPRELGRMEAHMLSTIEARQKGKTASIVDIQLCALQHPPYKGARSSVLIHLEDLAKCNKLNTSLMQFIRHSADKFHCPTLHFNYNCTKAWLKNSFTFHEWAYGAPDHYQNH
ncbi:hypothetical protein L210DRAFT_935978 [Boletus edulis BED1]|uniref:Uncharacterized protein n=1 Tax=Boletus edulis BED1 TaxID=1328754 RepID=A0AAD4C0D6_BOLED|nr:hypothetical protein L210DRAFT_935978 [Boletus edulis BED1]